MFFRNLTLFRFSATAGKSLGELDTLLGEHPLRACGPLEMFTRGFVSPLGPDEEVMTRTLGHHTLFSLGQEDKLLPAAVVAAETSRRARARAASEGGPVSARQRRGIKQSVMEELLPKAFSRPSRTDAYVDRKHGWLVIDTASRKKAETLLGSVREALSSFPALPLAAGETPRALLTRWLDSGDLPAGLELGDECELRDPGAAGGAVVRCRHQDLTGDEIREHLRSGKQVFQLGLHFDDRLSMVLGEDLVIRKLRFHDVVVEELSYDSSEDASAEIDARFALMSLELEKLLEHLAQWFSITRPEQA
ncbi:MAG: recombination-associated protein RdgC [Rhodanobacteraceae bacterium]